MHDPERSKYPFMSITESFKCIVDMKQKYNESLVDYSKFLKQAKDILGARIGKDVLENYVDNLDKFKNTIVSEKKNKIKSEEFNKWMAYLFVSN